MPPCQMLDEGRKRVIGIMAAICPALRSRITSVYAGKNMAERVGFVYYGICYLSPSQAHRQELTVLQ